MRTLLIAAALLFPATLLGAPDITKDLKDEKQQEIERLKGTWTVTGSEIVGLGNDIKPANENLELTFSEKDIVPVKNGQKQDGEVMTYSIDPSKKPKHFDMTAVKAKPGQPGFVEGIYELTENRLILCFKIDPGDETKKSTRPASFDDKPDDGNGFLVKITLERKKKEAK